MAQMILFLTKKQEEKIQKYKQKNFEEDKKISKQTIISHIIDNMKI